VTRSELLKLKLKVDLAFHAIRLKISHLGDNDTSYVAAKLAQIELKFLLLVQELGKHVED